MSVMSLAHPEGCEPHATRLLQPKQLPGVLRTGEPVELAPATVALSHPMSRLKSIGHDHSYGRATPSTVPTQFMLATASPNVHAMQPTFDMHPLYILKCNEQETSRLEVRPINILPGRSSR